MSVSVKCSEILNIKDRHANHCDVTVLIKQVPYFIKWVPVT